jgi:hypothetical protein
MSCSEKNPKRLDDKTQTLIERTKLLA